MQYEWPWKSDTPPSPAAFQSWLHAQGLSDVWPYKSDHLPTAEEFAAWHGRHLGLGNIPLSPADTLPEVEKIDLPPPRDVVNDLASERAKRIEANDLAFAEANAKSAVPSTHPGPAPVADIPTRQWPPAAPHVPQETLKPTEQLTESLGKRFVNFIGKNKTWVGAGAGIGLAAIGVMSAFSKHDVRREREYLKKQPKWLRYTGAVTGATIGAISASKDLIGLVSSGSLITKIGHAVSAFEKINRGLLIGRLSGALIGGQTLGSRAMAAGEIIGEISGDSLAGMVLSKFTKIDHDNPWQTAARTALTMMIGHGVSSVSERVGFSIDQHASRPYTGPMIKHTTVPVEGDIPDADSRHKPGGLHVNITHSDIRTGRKQLDTKLQRLYAQGYAY